MSKKDTVKQFDLDAAFKALNELEMPVARGGIRPQRENLTERFSKTACSHTDALLEDYFDVSDPDELEDAKDMREDEIAKAKLARIEKIVDLDAESPEDIQPSYVGKIIVQCPQCMTLFYKAEEDLEPSEDDPKVVNVGEACQHCGNVDGYNVIGGVQAVDENEFGNDEEEAAAEGEENVEEEPAEEEATEETEEVEEAPEEETIEGEEELEEIPEEETQESFNNGNGEPLVESNLLQEILNGEDEILNEEEDPNEILDEDADELLEGPRAFVQKVKNDVKQKVDRLGSRLRREKGNSEARDSWVPDIAKKYKKANSAVQLSFAYGKPEGYEEYTVAKLGDQEARVGLAEDERGFRVLLVDADKITGKQQQQLGEFYTNIKDDGGVAKGGIIAFLKTNAIKYASTKDFDDYNKAVAAAKSFSKQPKYFCAIVVTKANIKTFGGITSGGNGPIAICVFIQEENKFSCEGKLAALAITNLEKQLKIEVKRLEGESETADIALDDETAEEQPAEETSGGEEEKPAEDQPVNQEEEKPTEEESGEEETGTASATAEDIINLINEHADAAGNFVVTVAGVIPKDAAGPYSKLGDACAAAAKVSKTEAKGKGRIIVSADGGKSAIVWYLRGVPEVKNRQGKQTIEVLKKFLGINESLEFNNFNDIIDNALNEHISKYLTDVYENVKAFDLKECALTNTGNLKVEGIITYTSGNQANTTFTFNRQVLSEGKSYLIGSNKQMSENDSFVLGGTVINNAFLAESLYYKYNIGQDEVSGRTDK